MGFTCCLNCNGFKGFGFVYLWMCCKAAVTKGQFQHFFIIFRKAPEYLGNAWVYEIFSTTLVLGFGLIFLNTVTHSAI